MTRIFAIAALVIASATIVMVPSDAVISAPAAQWKWPTMGGGTEAVCPGGDDCAQGQIACLQGIRMVCQLRCKSGNSRTLIWTATKYPPESCH